MNGGPASLNRGLGGGATRKLLSRPGSGAGDVWAAPGEDGGVRNSGLAISRLCGSTGDGGAVVAVAAST